jgi:hypothetical protein
VALSGSVLVFRRHRDQAGGLVIVYLAEHLDELP